MLTRRQLLTAGVATLGAAVGGYTWLIEPHWVQVARRRMPLPGLPPELRGRTLLQVSDLHVGPRVDPEYLIRALRTAAALAPDFVVVTGDFISYRRGQDYRELARVLRYLPRGRLATVAALGNHDYGVAWRELAVADAVSSVVRDVGATVLRNEAARLGGLQFAGLGDLWSSEFSATHAAGGPGAAATLAALDRAAPTVVLCHNPDALDLPVWDGVRGWVLAGHTHGGQCKPPFLPPPLLPVKNRRYTEGAFDVGPGRRLYVNRGLGHLIQVRFNVRPEITLFTLDAA
jgi:uncharacterized protein